MKNERPSSPSHKLVTIIRTNREAIYATYIERLRQVGPYFMVAPEEVLRRDYEGILTVLTAYWEHGNEAKVHTWAEQQSQPSPDRGFPLSEVLDELDLLAELIRPYLMQQFSRRTGFLAALTQLEEGIGFLRRCYLGAYTATAIKTARLYEQEQQRHFELQVLYDLSQKIGYTLNYDELVRLILEHLHRAVPHDVVAGIMWTGGLCEVCIGPTRPLFPAVQEEIKHRLLNAFARVSAKEIHLDPRGVRLLESDVFDTTQPPIAHLGSAFQVPLIVGPEEGIIGLLFVGAEQENAFTEEQVRLLYTIANQAALSLQRLRALLATEQRRLESVVNNLPEGVLLLDIEGRILLANPQAKKYLAALTRAGVGDVLHSLGGRPMAELLRPPPAGNLSHEMKVEGIPPRVFELETRPMKVGAEFRGWVLVLRDVTADREGQERLQQQERLATVGQLAAGIAHDFNNLLTSIIGSAELLQTRTDLPEPAQPHLTRIVQQGQQAAHLIRQILDFSRKSISRMQPLDLGPFLKEAIKFLKRTIPESIHIVLEIAAGEHPVRADLTQIQQILINLAVNARDAMPKGGELGFRLSHLTLKPEEPSPFPKMPPGEWIVLSISDTGTGIPADVLPHIFEPFFTTKESGRGAGLGLAQVYGIVKQHEGFIDVKSRVGKGTTFTIYLPSTLDEQHETLAAKPLRTFPRGQGELILLVEDEPDVLETNSALLEHLGYRVLSARNGEEALQAFEAQHDTIALVLTDMVMPGMGGAELCRTLRQKDPSMPVVVLSGYPLGIEIENPREEGISDWLQKPATLERLAQAVQRALAHVR
jgi:signal transduction histidine kinase/ActR/RegA family two-component response regulator